MEAVNPKRRAEKREMSYAQIKTKKAFRKLKKKERRINREK